MLQVKHQTVTGHGQQWLLNDWDFRTISNFRTISGQLCNFRNYRTAGIPATSTGC